LGKKQTAVIGIILIVAIYVTYKVINLIKNPSDTFFIEKGKIYEEENAIGYIIRDEKVVKGENYKNGLVQIKAEGEKVAKGEAIFRYYTNGEEKIRKQIQGKQEEAKALQQLGYSVYIRDLRSDRYDVENISNFFIDENNNIYVIYAYGNSSNTDVTDIVIF